MSHHNTRKLATETDQWADSQLSAVELGVPHRVIYMTFAKSKDAAGLYHTQDLYLA